jgi:predicted dehydrogenase
MKRRDFLTNSIVSGTLLTALRAQATVKSSTESITPRLQFGVVGINHGHIYGMANAIKRGGGIMKSYYVKEDDLAVRFAKAYPEAKRVATEAEVLQDNEIKLVLSAGIPIDRAPLGIRVMKAGKDYMSDKPGIITLKQLAEVKKAQKETNKKYIIVYSERFENRATIKAQELVANGEIGKVVQTIGLGPHSMHPEDRPDWFFDMKQVGGIITDIGSHQFDQFLYFTGSTEAKILAAQVKNVANKQYKGFQDFGDVMLEGNNGSGYIRIDWYSPKGLKTWGDGRLTILGTDGFIEIRKNIDIARYPNGNHLYISNQEGTRYIDCNDVDLPFGPQVVDDVLNRTETAMTQEHCFLTMELALKAQEMANARK